MVSTQRTFSKSGISSLEVTSPISPPPTVSGMAAVITYIAQRGVNRWANVFIMWPWRGIVHMHTLCNIAFDRLASFPPFKRRPLPLRTANEAIYVNHKSRGYYWREKTELWLCTQPTRKTLSKASINYQKSNWYSTTNFY